MVRERRPRTVLLVLVGFAGGLFGGFLASLLRGPQPRDVATPAGTDAGADHGAERSW